MKHRITIAAQAVLGFLAAVVFGPPPLRRAVTHDVAFGFRMGAGFPGDVNRMHPASIQPYLMDSTDVVAAYGNPVLAKTANDSVKGFVAADTTTPVFIAGFAVRPYPTQQQSQSNVNSAIGSAAPAPGVIDVIDSGFVMAKVPAGSTCHKGGTVYVWFAASSGSHVQGQLEVAATGGSTALITNAKFNGPADANGNVEVRVWPEA